MMKQSLNNELADWAFKYDAAENFCETLERFGLGNPGKCSSCGDYGCAETVGKFIDRVLGTDSIDE